MAISIFKMGQEGEDVCVCVCVWGGVGEEWRETKKYNVKYYHGIRSRGFNTYIYNWEKQRILPLTLLGPLSPLSSSLICVFFVPPPVPFDLLGTGKSAL